MRDLFDIDIDARPIAPTEKDRLRYWDHGLNLNHLHTLTGYLPIHVHGDIYLRNIRRLKPGYLPERVDGNLFLDALTVLKPGCLPEHVGGYLFLEAIRSLQPGCLPREIGGLYLDALKTLEPGCLPRRIGRTLRLGITKLKPGCMPDYVGDSLVLSSLAELEPGCLPRHVGGGLDLSGLVELRPGCLPRYIGYDLWLFGLRRHTLTRDCLHGTILGGTVVPQSVWRRTDRDRQGVPEMVVDDRTMKANRLRAARLAAGLTQEQLAHRIGVVSASVSRWERAVVAPSPLAMAALRQCLQVNEDPSD